MRRRMRVLPASMASRCSSANNYLLEQFIRDSTNRRTDEYGGSVENRLRFPLAAVKAAVDAWDGGGRVGVRISPTTTSPGETPLDSDVMGTYSQYIDGLNALGIAYIHVIEGVTRETREASGDVDFLSLRKRFRGSYLANNRYDKELAEEALNSGRADLVSFGRPFIANPDLVERLRDGSPLAEAPRNLLRRGREGLQRLAGLRRRRERRAEAVKLPVSEMATFRPRGFLCRDEDDHQDVRVACNSGGPPNSYR